MPAFPPLPKPMVVAALLLLGVVTLGGLCLVAGHLFPGKAKPQVAVSRPAGPVVAAATPHPSPSATPKAVQPPASSPAPPVGTPATDDPLAIAAERALVASLPRPTPLSTPPPAPSPVRREVTQESRVIDLVNQARVLRDRGDTGTALTRLREAQAIFPSHSPIISEMALTYEKMGLKEKSIEQWRRIYEMGEGAGIYSVAAEAKLSVLQMPEMPRMEAGGARPVEGALMPGAEGAPVLSLGNVGTTDDTGNTQPLRRLRLRVPIQARAGSQVDPRDVVIQVFFYDQLKDGSLVETNADVTSSWARRTNSAGDTLPVDWSAPDPEVLEVSYSQLEFDPKDPRTRERRNYFGYSVRVYYKGALEAKCAEPQKLLSRFIPPATLPTPDLPQ